MVEISNYNSILGTIPLGTMREIYGKFVSRILQSADEHVNGDKLWKHTEILSLMRLFWRYLNSVRIPIGNSNNMNNFFGHWITMDAEDCRLVIKREKAAISAALSLGLMIIFTV